MALLKNKFSLLFIFILFVNVSYAQRDLIVTKAGENIRCKILDESASEFKYVYLNSKKELLKSLIFKSLVTSFKYNYYNEDLVDMSTVIGLAVKKPKKKKEKSTPVTQKAGFKTSPIDTITLKVNKDSLVKEHLEVILNDSLPGRDEKSDFKNFMRFRVGAKAGGGYQALQSNGTSAYGQYKDKLKTGFVFGFDAHYFLNDYVGLGFNYINFTSSNESAKLDYPSVLDNSSIVGKKLSNKISSKLIAPSFALRKSLNYKSYVVATLSPGLLLYTDKGKMDLGDFKLKGNTFGAAGSIAYDLLLGNDIIGRDLILSIEVGMVYGVLNKIDKGGTIGVQTLSTPLNLSRGDVTIGLRFTRFPYVFR